MLQTSFLRASILLSLWASSVWGFGLLPSPSSSSSIKHHNNNGRLTHVSRLQLASTESDEKKDNADTKAPASDVDGVVELLDDESEKAKAAVATNTGPQGPLFLSQGEVDPDALEIDFSNAKQTRVLIYTIISLLPVLFLIPFMLSREFIPQDIMPPVDM